MKIKEERKVMEKLNRGRTLSEKAYDALCNVICKMAPGNNRLPSEDDLANNMGVSRATIREALKHLMLDGVTTTIHGKGTFAHPSVFEIENRIDLYSDFYMMLTEHFGPRRWSTTGWARQSQASSISRTLEIPESPFPPAGFSHRGGKAAHLRPVRNLPGLCDARNYRRRKHYEFATAQPEIHECAD